MAGLLEFRIKNEYLNMGPTWKCKWSTLYTSRSASKLCASLLLSHDVMIDKTADTQKLVELIINKCFRTPLSREKGHRWFPWSSQCRITDNTASPACGTLPLLFYVLILHTHLCLWLLWAKNTLIWDLLQCRAFCELKGGEEMSRARGSGGVGVYSQLSSQREITPPVLLLIAT